MNFKLDFEMNNAAFDDDPIETAKEILNAVAAGLNIDFGDGKMRTREYILDVNGNTIGEWEIT